jgi:hypothetical protein
MNRGRDPASIPQPERMRMNFGLDKLGFDTPQPERMRVNFGSDKPGFDTPQPERLFGCDGYVHLFPKRISRSPFAQGIEGSGYAAPGTLMNRGRDPTSIPQPERMKGEFRAG